MKVMTALDDWPMFGLTSDVRPALAEARAAGEPCVLATLGAAQSGAPLGAGAQMLFTRRGLAGFLSGGCVEADVAFHAAEVLQGGKPRTLVYGAGGAVDIRLPCGGRVVMLLERIAPDDGAAGRLVAPESARRPMLWLTDGRRRTCLAPGEAPPAAFRPLMDTMGDRAAMTDAGDRLACRFDPRQRLIVVGHDPIALGLAELGLKIGWATTLVRPLGPEGPPPIADLEYRRGHLAAEFGALAPDPWTAVVIATHDQDHDHAGAQAALASTAGYIGLLGSRRRLPDRLARLQADGGAADVLARVHAPVGLAIGARTPYEIAVSITAEIVQATREASAGALWPFWTAMAA